MTCQYLWENIFKSIKCLQGKTSSHFLPRLYKYFFKKFLKIFLTFTTSGPPSLTRLYPPIPLLMGSTNTDGGFLRTGYFTNNF